MARSLLCVAIVVLAWAPSAASPSMVPTRSFAGTSTLALAMADACADEKVVDITKREAARIWAAAGVVLRWMPMSELPITTSPSDWAVVRCTDGESTILQNETARVPIAAVRFANSRPSNTILFSVRNATLLLMREAHSTRYYDERPRLMRDTKLGRMLGRAIAHEIGHFLSQSAGHTRNGLMRANHSVAALVGDSRVPFRIDATFQRLAARDAPKLPSASLPLATASALTAWSLKP